MIDIWYKISDWFKDTSERHRLVRSFNVSAREAFTVGIAPTLLEATTSRGSSAYKHEFSRIQSGFRLKVLSGRRLTKEEMKTIGRVILDNQELLRKLIVLGWDTLEVQDNQSPYGLKWKLTDFASIKLLST